MILDKYGKPVILDRAAQQIRAWDAGQVGRRLRAVPTSTRSINTLIRTYGSTVLARSRYLTANNSYAAMARDAYVGAMVGTGIVPSPLLDDADLKKTVQQVWMDWTDEADADWLTDFYGLQSICAHEMFEAGEVFVRIRQRLPQDGLLVPMQLQVLPAEMLDTKHNLQLDNGQRIECGIQFDAIGRRIAYHFWRVQPGTDQIFGAQASQRTVVPADEVLHLYRPIRAGQIRGIPHTLSAMVRLAGLDAYDDAELERKRIAALFGAFIIRPSLEEEDHPLGTALDLVTPRGETQPSPALEPGITVDLGPGEDIKFAEPADVGGSYEPFQLRQLQAISAGMGVPYADMTGDLRQANYGSMRAGMVAFRRRIEQIQHSVMVYQLCRPIYNRWWTEAVLAGALPVTPAAFAADQRTFRRVEWIPPHWDWIDPLKDLEAEEIAVANHFKPRSAVIKAMGNDPEVVDEQIKQDREREAALGTAPAVPRGSTQPLPPESQPTPAPAQQEGT